MSKSDSIAVPPLLKRLDTKKQKSEKASANGLMAVNDVAKIDSSATKAKTGKSLLQWKAPKAFNIREIRFQNEGYFKNNPYYRPELGMTHSGVLGDPAPYNVSNDNLVSGTVLICFVLAMLAASMSSNFILRQIKSIFNLPYRRTTVGETAHEIRFQFFLVLQTALLMSVAYYLFTKPGDGGDYILDSQLAVVGIFAGIFLSYFLIKNLLYSLVNWVFFDRKSSIQWSQLSLFLFSTEGVLIFPAVLLLIYFGLSPYYTLIYIAAIVGLVKIVQFYQGYLIFFRRTAVSLQIILYFCTLEIMPLAALLGVLQYTDNYLTINF